MNFSFIKWSRFLSFFVGLIIIGLSATLAFLFSKPTSNVIAEPLPILTANLGVPTIDGYVDPTEWAAAEFLTSKLQNSNPEITGTLYVMQDSTNIYFGFTIADDEFTELEPPNLLYGLYGDTLQFRFDDNNNGVLFDIGENIVGLRPTDPIVIDKHFINDTGSSTPDTGVGGENNGIGMIARHDDLNHFELSFPICSADSYDFCLGPGSIFGVNLDYYDIFPTTEGVSGKALFFPYGSIENLVQIELIEISSVYLPLIQK